MNTTTIYISVLLQLILVGSHLSASPGASITLYFEACDGSAGVALNDRYFASAEDEHNTLRAAAGGVDMGLKSAGQS